MKNIKLNQPHSFHEEYDIVKFQTEIVPVILMPSCPRKNNIDQRESYAKIILTLFKPWRSVKDINSCNNWIITLDRFLLTANKDTLTLINNVEYLKKSQDDAEEEKKVFHNNKKSLPTEHQLFTNDNDNETLEHNLEFLDLTNSNIDSNED